MHTRLALVLYVLVQKASHLRYKILAANLNFSRLLWSLTSERDDVSLGSDRPEETAEIHAILQRETELR